MAKFEAEISANIGEFQKNIEKAIGQAKKFADDVKTSAERASNNFKQQIDNIGKKLQELGPKMTQLGTILSVSVTAPLTALGVTAFKAAADIEDAMGAVNQIFGTSAQAVIKWSDQLSSAYGISKKEALEYSNVMGSMLVNIGNLTQKEAAEQSAKLIELAGDLTAMYGGTTQDAVRALTGALKGNNTMLDNYGMAANDALVKAKALSLGLVEQGKEMSLAAKQTATLALIYDQSGKAQGQAAREAEGASGSIRSLQTEITNLATEMGSHLLPIITPLINGVKNIASSFRELTPDMQRNIVIIAGLAAAIGPLLIALGAIIAIAPSIAAAWALITGPIGLAVTAVTAATILIIANLDKVKSALSSVTGAIGNFANKIGLDGLGKSLKGFSESIDPAKQKLKEFNDSNKEYASIADQATKKTDDQSKKIVDLGVNTEETKKKTVDYKRQLVESLASMGDYEAGLTAIGYKYADLIKLAKQAGAGANVLSFLGAEEGKEKNLLALENTLTSIKGLVKDFDFTGGFLNTEAISKDLSRKSGITLSGISIDTKAVGEQMRASLDELKTPIANYTDELTMAVNASINEAIAGGLTNLAGSIGDAIANGDNVLKAAGGSLLSSFGGIMVELGGMAIKSGIAIEAVKKALTTLSGPVAIAAGIGLVAIGSAFKAGASKLGNSMGSGSGGYASSSVSSNADYSQFRGALYNNDKQTVELVLKNSELRGAIQYGNNRNNRLA